MAAPAVQTLPHGTIARTVQPHLRIPLPEKRREPTGRGGYLRVQQARLRQHEGADAGCRDLYAVRVTGAQQRHRFDDIASCEHGQQPALFF
jgi:hypothetical protein